jgi:AcrR family transcriptional regulator
MTKIVDQEAWIKAGMGLLDRGVVPAEVGYVRIGEKIGAGKGSFRHHFKKADSLHVAVIDRFLQEANEAWAAAAPAAGVVMDPLDEIRQMRKPAMQQAARIATMIDWSQVPAASRPAVGSQDCECWDKAQQVVGEFTGRIQARVRLLLKHLLLPEDEVDAEADVIAPEVGGGRPRWPAGSDRFEAHLRTLARAARAGAPVTEVVDLPGMDGVAVILLGRDAGAGRPALGQRDREQVAVAAGQIARLVQHPATAQDEAPALNGSGQPA